MGNGGYIYVDLSVLEALSRYKQNLPKATEAGGFLVGYYKEKDIHVINLTHPLPGDKRGRYYFKRRDMYHVEQVKKWYLDSGGEINCLGEWHTHPEPYPTPSNVDTSGWRIFNRDRQGQHAIFLIVGTFDLWVGGY